MSCDSSSTSVFSSPGLTDSDGCGAPSFLRASLCVLVFSSLLLEIQSFFDVMSSSPSSCCLISPQDVGLTPTLEQFCRQRHDVQLQLALRHLQLTTLLHVDPVVQLQHKSLSQGDVNHDCGCLILGGFVSRVPALFLGPSRSDRPLPQLLSWLLDSVFSAFTSGFEASAPVPIKPSATGFRLFSRSQAFSHRCLVSAVLATHQNPLEIPHTADSWFQGSR